MMKTISLILLCLAALVLPTSALVSVSIVDTPDKMPEHLKFRTSPGSNGLTNVWITIHEANPDDVGIWASLETQVDGKLHSRASLVSHRCEEGYSVSFQMKKAAFAESSIMVAVRGGGRSDVGYQVQLSMFEPEADPPE